MSTINFIRVGLGVLGLLCGLALGTWAHADDRYGSMDLGNARIYIVRCMDEARLYMEQGKIGRATRRQTLDFCINRYAKEVKESVYMTEKLVEEMTKHLYPEATLPAEEHPLARLGREHREAAERVRPTDPILRRAYEDLQRLNDYNDERARTGK